MGIKQIAERLNRDGVPCPSAHDPARNPHRTHQAWLASAVRAILTNPRYTGRQVWNRQRKEEVLLNVDDVALGHETKLRWNTPTSGSGPNATRTNLWSASRTSSGRRR
jgi:site-specific DNA recombinase